MSAAIDERSTDGPLVPTLPTRPISNPMKTPALPGLLCLSLISAAPAADKRPNLIVMLTDDQRVGTLTCYDAKCAIQTPNIDRLAKRGMRFDQAFVTTPICCASRASILTGRYASNARVHEFKIALPEEVFEDSYPMHLKRAGYFIGQLGKYGVGIRPKEEIQFDVFDAQEGQGPAFRDCKGKKMHDAEWLTVKTEEFLDRVPQGRPFCVQINYKEPHGSSEVAPEDDHLLDTHVFPRHPMDNEEQNLKLPEFVRKSFLGIAYRKEFNPGGDHNPFLRDYHEKIAAVDRSVGKILAMLETRGIADNTVIVYLSDHGVHFGERRIYGKWTPYDASLRIPLLVSDPRPGAKRDAASARLVLNIDIAPTLLELAGIPVPGTMDGASLVPLLKDDAPVWRDRFFFEHYTSPAGMTYIPRNIGVRTADAKFFRWIDAQAGGVESLYDLRSDAMESNDLIRDPEKSAQAAELRAALDQWREKHPANYDYDVYGRRPGGLAPEIDWKKFAAARPKEYARIKAQVEDMGVTWEQAMNDWATRLQISSRSGYWY